MIPYTFNYLFATTAVVLHALSDHPDKIAFLFAAVIFCINGAAAKAIDAIKKARRPY